MEENRVFNYDFALLRNFKIKQLDKFLKKEIENYNDLFKKNKTNNGYLTIEGLLEEYINNGMDDQNIESTLFKSLVYLKTEKLFCINFDTNLDINTAMKQVMEKYNNVVGRKVTHKINSQENLVTIRREGEKIIFLFKEGVAELGRVKKEKCNFYVPCIIDFREKHLTIRFNQLLLRKCSVQGKALISDMEIFIKQLFNFNKENRDFYLKLKKGNEAKIHKGLYKLFKKESLRSLDLIRAKVQEKESTSSFKWTEEKLREDISEYLKEELRVFDPAPYVNRVLSVKYQDTAKNMEEGEFVNDGGYIFGFTFVDRKITKSVNKNEKRKPVYHSKIYWDLKDTIEDYEEIIELAMYWKFCKDDYSKKVSQPQSPEDLSFVEVAFKETHNVLEIHYYVNYDNDFLINSIDERMCKENYVLDKIKRFI